LQIQEERYEKLESLMKKYPHIDRARHLKDLEFCKKYQEGDRLPFERMFQVAYSKLERYVHYDSCGKQHGIHINEQDKEDLIADVASTAIQYMAAFQGWSLFSTWMIAIARHRIIGFIKKRCHEKRNSSDAALDDSRIIVPSSSQNDSTTIWEMLSCLSESDAAIVRLKAVERLTYTEIAKQLNLSVKKVLFRYKTSVEILKSTLLNEIEY